MHYQKTKLKFWFEQTNQLIFNAGIEYPESEIHKSPEFTLKDYLSDAEMLIMFFS